MAKAPSKPAAPALQGADNALAGNDPAGNDPAGGVVQAPAENLPAQVEDPVPPAAPQLIVLRRVDLGAGPIEVGDALPDGLDETVLEQLHAAGVI